MAFQLNRLERLRKKIHDSNLDGMYIRDTSNIRWLTGFESVFDEESSHVLFVSDADCLLHSDSRYSSALRKAAAGTPIKVNDEPVGHFSYVLREASNENNKIGIETTISLGEFRQMEQVLKRSSKSVQLIETKGLCCSLRGVKDAEEIATMKKAQAITDAAFDYIVSYIKPGMSERQVQLALDRFMYDHGSVGLAFGTIVATGSHAASPHAQPGDTIIQPGDAIVMDFGACVNDYCSDMTRTVFVGEPSEDMARAFSALQKANKTCEEMLHPGVIASDVHNEALRILAEAGFEGKMGHALGHSVGIDIHEEPNLSPRNNAPLEAGNVVTVEPGIYCDGQFGMRLEDFGVITEDGFEVFTQSTHDMVIIEVH